MMKTQSHKPTQQSERPRKKKLKSRPSSAKTIGACSVLGFGSQGAAIALNLRDSGCDITIGLPTGSKSRSRAKRAGFSVTTVSRAVAAAQTIIFCFPDHCHQRTFANDIAKHLHPKQTLIFLHGTSISFSLVSPPTDVDIVMLAPHGPGLAVREQFVTGANTMSAFWAIQQDASGNAKKRLLAFAKAIGISAKSKLIQTTFSEEAVGDLFGEQTVLCGGLTELIHAGFTTLTEAGVSSDNAYLEVCYQLDLIVSLIKRFGIEGMYQRISVAAKYGSLKTGPKLIDAGVKKRMQTTLKNIQSGAFARELSSLTPAQLKQLDKELKKMTSPEFEKAARKFGQ